jgi:hypothetical protein
MSDPTLERAEPPIGRARYEEHVGSEFSASDDASVTDHGGAITLVLDRVQVCPSPPGSEQYALFFRGDHEVPLSQQTYHIVHQTLGLADIFLVPVGRSGSSIEYQACFSHPTTTD